MKVAPFHTKADPSAPYHDNNKCTEGNNIESYNRVSGSGSRRHCTRCAELNAAGK